MNVCNYKITMNKFLIQSIFIAFILICEIHADNYNFISDSIKYNTVLPTLANGHVGIQVFNNSILVNGLYNGLNGKSHRAHIPNYANVQLTKCLIPIQRPSDYSSPAGCTYTLNSRDGIFETIYTHAYYIATHKLYAHRFYNRAIINEITINRIGTQNATISVAIFQSTNKASLDTYLTENIVTMDNSDPVFYTFGNTIDVENLKYQDQKRPIFIYSHVVPVKLILQPQETTKTFQFFTTVDFVKSASESEFTTLQNLQNSQATTDILSKHTSEWDKLWERFGIEVEGNDELAKSIHNSLFFLASSLPSLTTNLPKNKFYGLSPSGLGKGGILYAEYQGHSFWDTEMWMHPPMLLLQPEWSADILNYRFEVRNAARDNAKQTFYKGIRYPWESAYTGVEVTPECCPEVVRYQHHITADVAFALRSHLFATHDLDWLRREGCELAVGTAEFWESHVVYHEKDDVFELRNIMGPDEDKWGVSNNPYTNVVAGYNLYFGEFASCVCKEILNMENYGNATKWTDIASKLKLLYDPVKKYNPQYEGFKADHEIKQADTVLLAYPLQYRMDADTIRNNLHIYEGITRKNGPAMTWAMHVVGHLDVGDVDSAAALYNRSFVDYIRKPFYIWSEVLEMYEGAGNFITGAGGFLQSIINGYGGIRLYNDTLYILNPRLPPEATRLSFAGVTYLGTILSLDITKSNCTVTIKTLGSIKVNIEIDGESETACEGCTYEIIPDQMFVVQAKNYAFGTCSLPADQIKKFDYSTASTLEVFAILYVFLIAFRIF